VREEERKVRVSAAATNERVKIESGRGEERKGAAAAGQTDQKRFRNRFNRFCCSAHNKRAEKEV
jgi:uncharacterized protein YaiI (UPF0178 family)